MPGRHWIHRAGALALALAASSAQAAAPTATTEDAEVDATDRAHLQGTSAPNALTTTRYFRYSLSNPGTCNDLFGSRAPASGGTFWSGTTQSFSQEITGLTAGATYYYCAIATNADGVALGVVRSFTMVPAAPTVTTEPAGPIPAITSQWGSATLNGSANPNQSSTYGYFRYSLTNPGTCDDVFGSRVPAGGGLPVGGGTGSRSYSMATGYYLLPGATYYYCAIASNWNGTGFGAVMSFTTPAAVPVVTTNIFPDPATRTGTTARIGASINPRGGETTGWFRYATSSPGSCNDSFGTRVPASGGTSVGSGRSPVDLSPVLTGLAPGTTYYYCPIAQNAAGTSFGIVASVTTPLPPEATTWAARDITNASATLRGRANPRGAPATSYFRYSLTDPGTCDDTFGTRAPATGGPVFGGSSPQDYGYGLTGLSAGTTYYYCAVAVNAEGAAFGAVIPFTTATAPAATTSAASGVTSSTATLNGAANPNGAAASGYYRYSMTDPGTCDDTFGTRVPASSTDDASLGSGYAEVGYGQPLSALLPGATYYYCAIANNAYGRAYGAVLSFTTPPAPPAAATDAATLLTGRTAQLNGTANPGGAPATGWFRYSASHPGTCDDGFGTRAPAAGGSTLAATIFSTSYSQPVAGLAPGTTYHYCAIARTAVGTAFGAVLSFTTPLEPTVQTLAATAVDATSATLHGLGVASGQAAVGWFRYGVSPVGACDDTFGTRVPASSGSSLGSGTSGVPFEEALTGLVPGTTYQFCAIVQSAAGIVYGALESFTTPALPPAVTTLAATGVMGSAATLNGSAVPSGGESTGWFRYAPSDPGACDDAFGTRAPASGGTSLGAGHGPVAFSQALTGLAHGTTYYVCAIAGNAAGTRFGEVQVFQPGLAAPTVTTEAATAVQTTGATVAGTANPNGSETSGWFRVGDFEPVTCDDSFGARAPASGAHALGAGIGAVAFTEELTGLEPSRTYSYCAAASSLGGASFGPVRSFTTPPAPPAIRTLPAAVTGTDVTLTAAANPRGAQTTAWFRYDAANPGSCNDTFGTRTESARDAALGAGRAEVPFTQTISGWSAGTYYVCAIASSAGGLAYGALETFEVKAADAGATGPAGGGGGGGGCGQGAGGGSGGWVLAVLGVVLALARRRRLAG